MSEESERKALLQRAERAFAKVSLKKSLDTQRAIIGPGTEQMIAAAGEARKALREGRTPTPRQQAALEQAIRIQRPALLVDFDGTAAPLPDENKADETDWEAFLPRLAHYQFGVARLDRVNENASGLRRKKRPLGTGFLIAEDVLITAAHVLAELSDYTGRLEPGMAVADFECYHGQPKNEDPVELRSVIAVDEELDLAALRVARVDRPVLPELTGEVQAGSWICVVGYPLEDPRNPEGFSKLIFGDAFGVKRASIGEVISRKGAWMTHDCSTQGGNSGSPVFDISSGAICGIHVAGRFLTENEAVGSPQAGEFLRRVLRTAPFISVHTQTKTNVMKHQPRNPHFEKFFEQLQKTDPEIGEEVGALSEEMAQQESTRGGPAAEFAQETIVLTKGRPVLDVKRGEAVVEISEVESQVWKERLQGASPLLVPNIPAVGRIEIANHPDPRLDWIGTGWLIRDNIVVTNRHVAEVFGEAGGGGFTFKPGLEPGPMRTRIDFVEEFDSEERHECPVFRIVHIEKSSGPDLAFLRIEPASGESLPSAVKLSNTAAKSGDQIAVIGYPARDPFFPNPALMDRIFNNRYDKKRLAPGMVIGTASSRLFHDCSTLGGNSGGEVVSLATGEAVALHFAGSLFTRNHAVPADLVVSRLDDTLRSRPQPQKSGARESLPSASAAGSGTVIDATIPIRVRIELGNVTTTGTVGVSGAPQQTSASAAAAGPAIVSAGDSGEDDDILEVSEARPEDFLDRDGYQEDFLGSGFELPLPILTANADDTQSFEFEEETREVLDYRHFSVLMSTSRRMCRYSACNLNGKESRREKRKGWRYDPRMTKTVQIKNECYGNQPKFSRGHMTRREDPVWGLEAHAAQGNVDSMHVTNAVPQIQPFNAGIWLDLEDYALDHAREDDMRISVFTGPFLQNCDPVRFGVQIPILFWKIIAFIHDDTGKLTATGYTMSQESFIGEEEFVFAQHENNQRPIAEIEARAGLKFGNLAELDPMRDQVESTPVPLASPSQIRWA